MTDTWAAWTMADEAPDGWSHHGLALLGDGTLVGYHPGERQLLFFSPDGELLRRAACEAVEAHDIVVGADGESLWIADCGHKLCRAGADEFAVAPAMEDAVGQVLLVDLHGVTMKVFGAPDHPDYEAGGLFLPTGVAVDERGLWIADGYGSNLVHLVNDRGELLRTIEEPMDCPHGIVIDRRRSEPLLYVAERGEHRLCVYDLDGGLVRHVGLGNLVAPCSLATSGDHLLVADLVSRVTVFDIDDELVGHLGADRQATKRPGWPNAATDKGVTAPTVAPGRFNSPHGVVADGDGNVFVTEWQLGGRWVRCPAVP